MTRIADEETLMSKQGTGWIETWTEEGGVADLSICAWVQGFILMEGGNVFCLKDMAANYNHRDGGWGFRVWMISKPSLRQMQEAPWEDE